MKNNISMKSTIFLQSDVEDPFELYERMRVYNPVYWDDINNTWAVYSYEYCKLILKSSFVYIPSPVHTNDDGELNEFALLIRNKMARLSNSVDHEIARQVVMFLFSEIEKIDVNDIIKKLIKDGNINKETDWVDTICKKLPVMTIAKSFGFIDDDCDFISGNIEGLIKIMTPVKTPSQINAINKVAKKIYEITEKHLQKLNFFRLSREYLEEKHLTTAEIASCCTSNLIGLFIQSYDAGRGILSNSLLQMITNINLSRSSFTNHLYIEKCIIETLRFDPPVHNTRRVAIDDILINNIYIKKGDSIVVVLAAANRDPQKFHNPGMYDIERFNNIEHLTFGIGRHCCPANSFSISLTVDALSFLFREYNRIGLIEKDIRHEPLVNVRLPKKLFISLS